MDNKQYLSKTISDLKKSIKKEIKNNNFEIALELIFNCAFILYQTNQYYVDDELEDSLNSIAKGLKLDLADNLNNDTLLFYDGYGFNDRGLVQIYLKALCQLRKVIYVTYEEFKDRIPDIKNIVSNNNGEVLFLNSNRGNFVSKIKDINEIINTKKPKDFFFYSIPNDVVATTIMNAYEGVINRFQINLTDHAFWLGSKCIDKCIEFRDKGACISYKYRKIPKENIVKLPFYPMLHKEREFKGFPFEVKPNQKIIFSGGALYKTLGGENKYYKIIDTILSKHTDTIFWYAGFGDSTEINKVIRKYPNRVYLTPERIDLYQVIKHSRLFLNTYPISGGLMYQFAASAGKVPVNLRFEDDDGFLINQYNLNIEFDDIESLLDEVDKLLDNDEYYKIREKEMLGAVISEERFAEVLKSILNNDLRNILEIEYKDIDTTNVRKEYLNRLNKPSINGMLVDKDTMKAELKHNTAKLLSGVVYKIKKKI